MTTTKHTTELHPDRWLIPGTLTLAVLYPDLFQRHEEGELTEQETLTEIERRLRAIVTGAMSDSGVRDRSLIDDLIQALHERIATMDAAKRYDPSKASAHTYLRGITRMLIREALHRRQRPLSVPQEVIETFSIDGNQLDRAAHAEQRKNLAHWLDQLSAGEIRALVHEFGPLLDYSPPIGRRHRLRDPDALPRAVELLRQLAAHQTVQ